MILTTLDWLTIAAYFAVNLAIGFFSMKRTSEASCRRRLAVHFWSLNRRGWSVWR